MMTNDRITAFEELATALRRHAGKEGDIGLYASLPGESETSFESRAIGLTPSAAAVLKSAHRLDALSPLERDDKAGVWETIVVEAVGGKAWICIVNADGERDRVTTFGTNQGIGRHFEEWCVCREESLLGDTPWDEARKERRVVEYAGELTVIDRGANFVIDAVVAAGCRTVFSCEGHPSGAYLHFHGEAEDWLASEFSRLGWTVETDFHGGGVTVRMRPVDTVAERDAEWRRLSLELSTKPVFTPAPG